MIYEFAPLEGVTTHVQRLAHSAFFSPPDRYFTPFLALTQNHVFSPRELPEIARTHLNGVPVIPQVLTNNAAEFLWAARELAGRGFAQVNLNMGCPSGTVVSKGKGAGLLRDTDALRTFLDAIFSKTPIAVSIKTRIGLFDAQEWEEILAVLREYPVCELIVHPRVRAAYYGGAPELAAFDRVLDACAAPVSYNGDLFDAWDVRVFTRRFPRARAAMMGRGALANPAIFGELRGEGALERGRLQRYVEQIEQGYVDEMGAGNALGRLKELWLYLIGAFADAKKQAKRIRKCRSLEEYRDAVRTIFETVPLGEVPGYRREGFESIWTAMKTESIEA